MSPHVEISVSESVLAALHRRVEETAQTLSEVIDTLLAEALALERHSLFQVSTSNALIQGVFQGTMTVEELTGHGDFGLGTFDGLDGEMILLDGECYRAGPGGVIEVAAPDRPIPFALVTRFHPDSHAELNSRFDYDTITGQLDGLRPSENVFVGIKVDGEFDFVSMRVACRARPGEGLLQATKHQSEFQARDVTGTLVGFWAPEYSKAVSVPGYHLHFLSHDRSQGGHVLGLGGRRAGIEVHTESDVHLALPETAEFLSADLSGDHARDLSEAESERR